MCEKRSDQEISLRATKKIVRDNSKHKRSSRSSASYSLLIVKDGAQSGILMIRKVFLSKRCGVKKAGMVAMDLSLLMQLNWQMIVLDLH